MIGSARVSARVRMRSAASSPFMPGSIQSRMTRPKGSGLPRGSAARAAPGPLPRSLTRPQESTSLEQRLEQLPAGRGILHDQHRPLRQRGRNGACRRRLLRVGREAGGEEERRAGAGDALEGEVAGHEPRQSPADRQPEARAAVLARRGAVGLRERLKQFALLLLRDPDPGIPHGDTQIHMAWLSFAADMGSTRSDLAFVRELECVSDKIREHLAETKPRPVGDRWDCVRDELDVLLDDRSPGRSR